MTGKAGKRRDIRRQMRSRRAALDPASRKRAANAVRDNIAEIKILKSAEIVAGYLSLRGEVDLGEALKRLVDQGVTVTVPRVADDDLEFVEWLPTTATTTGAFGISEPVGTRVRGPAAHDVVLAPLVAFDRSGARIGQGGGFYDRCFGRLGDERPTLIGIAHDFQEVEQIPTEVWDVALDAVVTDSRLIEFRHRALSLERSAKRTPLE